MFAQSYAEVRKSQVDALYASVYGEALERGTLSIDLVLPQGVTFWASPCSCRLDDCFFCGAEITAMEVAEADDFWAEMDERYGRYYED